MKEKIDAAKKSYNEKQKAKKSQQANLMESVTQQLQDLKKKEGPERKLRKTDPCYADYMRALEITDELKGLRSEKKHVIDDLEKQLAAVTDKTNASNF